MRFKGSPCFFKRRQHGDIPRPASPSTPDPGLELIPQVDAIPTMPTPKPTDLDLRIAVRKGVKTCTKHPLANYLSYHRLSRSHKSFLISLDAIVIPNTVEEALNDPKWKEAMLEEMKALNKNQTWDIVSRPKGVKPVGCRWIVNLKYKADGTLEMYKAQLVAKGYTQSHGIDYLETFGLVAKITTVRILISLVATFGWQLHQPDIKNAFLHGDLEEEVFMELPPRLQQGVGKICRLKKALYRLKQSS